jgi:hypothetical protein
MLAGIGTQSISQLDIIVSFAILLLCLFQMRKLKFRHFYLLGILFRVNSEFDLEPSDKMVVFVLVVHELDLHKISDFCFAEFIGCLAEEVHDLLQL